DLPAPFSPVTACTEPADPCRERSTRAWVDPKLLLTEWNATSASRREECAVAVGIAFAPLFFERLVDFDRGKLGRHPKGVVQIRSIILVEIRVGNRGRVREVM